MEKVKTSSLALGDSIGAIALLVGVYLVIVVPPLALRAVLLAGVIVGVFLFAKYSHWTHKWSPFLQRTVSFIAAIGLLGVAIPQFISQWKAERPKPVTTQSSPAAAPVKPEGVILNDVHIQNFGETQMVNHAGKLSMKDSTIAGGKVGLDNRNPNAQINLDHSTIEGGQIGMINRGAQKEKDKPKKP